MNDCKIVKCKCLYGHRLMFTDAVKSDAEFIVGLRSDPQKNKHLSPTSPDVGMQMKWLDNYSSSDSQAYFIIHHASIRIGTVRIYDQQGDSFCWGSWLINDKASATAAIESALMIYSYALTLGFRRSHFDVRRENSSVWRFHERFGATRVAEDEHNFYYEISFSQIERALARYRKYLPNGISYLEKYSNS